MSPNSRQESALIHDQRSTGELFAAVHGSQVNRSGPAPYAGARAWSCHLQAPQMHAGVRVSLALPMRLGHG